MRVGLDFRPALRRNSRHRGIGRYTRSLTGAILNRNRGHDIILYSQRGVRPDLDGSFETRNLPFLAKPSRLNWLIDIVTVPWAVRRDGLHLFHAMDLTSIPRPGRRRLVVATVHDLIPFVYPDETRKSVPRDYRCALERSLKRAARADLVITDSEHSRRDICARLGVPLERVRVVPLGCDLNAEGVSRSEAAARVARLLGMESSYLLYVGGSDYRKNLPGLIEAFAGMKREGYPGLLLLVGETFVLDIPEVSDLRDRAAKLGVAPDVRFVGYVGDALLTDLYAACDFLVFPSRYEGFGLPVLEAMKCGAPLLISRASSLPEVAGEAAFYFDPDDIDDMLAAFRKACDSPRAVAEKVRLGRERAKRFSWDRAAREVLSLYDELAAREGPGRSGGSGRSGGEEGTGG
jgi:glycosyltransferase involved in cell wall biosynthesis